MSTDLYNETMKLQKAGVKNAKCSRSNDFCIHTYMGIEIVCAHISQRRDLIINTY
jgi:hypothetical protein